MLETLSVILHISSTVSVHYISYLHNSYLLSGQESEMTYTSPLVLNDCLIMKYKMCFVYKLCN